VTEIATGSPKAHGALAGREFSPPHAPDGDLTVVEILSVLLQRRRMVVGLPLLAAALTAIISLIVQPTYTATTSFVPEVRPQNRLPTIVASLGTQIGLPLGTEPSQSPRFYADVVRSRELLERLLLTSFPTGAGRADSSTLLHLVRAGGRDRLDSLARGVTRLNDLIDVRADNQTNIIRLSMDASDPDLAAALANRLLGYLNDFNTRTRQSQARERRKFVEERVSAAGNELGQAEDAVRRFYERNHGWQQAPELVFEEARLRRQVSISQEVFLTLKREYETARIEEVNDTPVFTVIDAAVPPRERSRPRRTLWVLSALGLGAAVSMSLAFAAQYWERVRREDPQYGELRALFHRARRDLPGVPRDR
jgi:uncharacterized protein involved in exopolysaccharide biosynthesis